MGTEKNIYELENRKKIPASIYKEKHKEIKTIRDGYDEFSKSYPHYKKLNDQYEKMMEINKKSQSAR